VVPRQ